MTINTGIETLGVDGSYHRRIHDLMVRMGFALYAVEDVEHPSKLTMIFRDGVCKHTSTTITIEAKLI